MCHPGKLAALALSVLVAACVVPELDPPDLSLDIPQSDPNYLSRAIVRNGAGKVILTYDRFNGEQVPPDFDAADYDGTVTVKATLGSGATFEENLHARPGEPFILRYTTYFTFEVVQDEPGVKQPEVEGD